MLDQQKLTILKKDGNDPVITFASGGREKKKIDQELDSSECER